MTGFATIEKYEWWLGQQGCVGEVHVLGDGIMETNKNSMALREGAYMRGLGFRRGRAAYVLLVTRASKPFEMETLDHNRVPDYVEPKIGG